MGDLVYIGTEMKINIGIEPIGDYSMDDYDFFCEFFCSPKSIIKIKKEEMIREDKDNYIAIIDSAVVSTGKLKCKITAYIPDTDCEDDLRTEVQLLDTGIQITKV